MPAPALNTKDALAGTVGLRASRDANNNLIIGHSIENNLVEFSQSPTITSGSAYVVGYAVGGLFTFANAVLGASSSPSQSGKILSVLISDKAKQNAALDLILFDSAPTAPTDHTAFAPSAADIAKIVGVVSITAAMYSSFSANAAAWLNPNLKFFLAAAGTSLYGILVARGTPTYASTSDLQLRLLISQD